MSARGPTLRHVRIDLTLTDIDGGDVDVAVLADDTAPVEAVAYALQTEPAAVGMPLVGALWGRPTGGLRTARATLDVVGGLDAGKSVPVPRGTCTVGRDPGCHLTLNDPGVSRIHATLTVTESGAVLHDLGSTNGISLDGVAADPGGQVLRAGEVVRVADTFLGLAELDGAPAAVRPGLPGRVLVNRRPRPQSTAGKPAIQLPTLPDESRYHSTQWLAVLLPALAGVGLAFALGSAQFLLFALLSPLALLASAGGDRLHRRRDGRRSMREYRRDLLVAQGLLIAGLRDEAIARRNGQPDPAALERIARTPLERLWERGRKDADLLCVRVGLASLPADLRSVHKGHEASAGEVHAVPLIVDLCAGPLGIAGTRRAGLDLARWLFAQLVVQTSPADVEVALLLSDGAATSWAWLRWVPHLRGRVATTAGERERLCADISDMIASRAGSGAAPPNRLILLVDRVGELGELPLLAGVLETGPAVGVTAVCVDDRETGLPAGCRAVAVLGGDTGARLLLREGSSARTSVPDQVDANWADRVARSVAAFVDAATDPGSALPEQCRLTQLISDRGMDGTEVLNRWRRSNARADTVLGIGVDGPVVVDLERDGPHALVAGTTGAGKSELLQTLVLGLALAHPPNEINFVLVDYKGGAGFADCERLPHSCGVVTDLDDGLTRRALTSLRAELRRRERLFADLGVGDLAAYRERAPAEPLARLVIVIDEFATLAADLPTFVDGVVAVAQRGRSLGIHLVLATQRPAGVVSKDIRANTALRIALRVTDPADSLDVLDSPDAAAIDRRFAGRALVRLGSAIVATQVARVAGPIQPTAKDGVTVAPLGPWRSLPPPNAPSDAPSELELLVNAVVDAAAGGGYQPVRRPWLPPLPEFVIADSLRWTGGNARRSAVSLGLVDLPDEQRRAPFEIDLTAGQSVLLTGGPRSGRTTGLFSLALAAACKLAPQELELYGIDRAGGALATLEQLPHTGSVASVVDDLSAVDVLLQRLCSDIARHRSRPTSDHGVRLLLVDGWEQFVDDATEYDGGQPVERMLALLRDGPSAGVTVAVSGGRATLAPRVAGHFAVRVLLPLSDPGDWALAGLAQPDLRSEPRPGRAVRLPDGAEVQLAVPGPAATPEGHLEAVRHCADLWRDAPRGNPMRVRSLPARVSLNDLGTAPGRWTLGVGGGCGDVIRVDLFAGSARILVAGAPRSGRSTVLQSLVTQAHRATVKVLVAAPARSPLRAMATEFGIDVLTPGDRSIAANPPDERTLLVVDDSEAFADTPSGDRLAEWARTDRPDLAVVVAGRSADLAVTFRGIAADLRRNQCGVLLQPTSVDGDLLGVRLPRTRHAAPPGRAMLVGDPAWGAQFAAGPLAIQLALP